MVMTNEEIVRDWAEAKNPAAQIAILAGLNVTKPDEIKKILRQHGRQIIANAYEQGYGLEKISKHYGFAPMTVRAMIIEAGGKSVSAKTLSQNKIAQITLFRIAPSPPMNRPRLTLRNIALTPISWQKFSPRLFLNCAQDLMLNFHKWATKQRLWFTAITRV